MVVSAWGIIMLGLLGVFFYIGAAALLEDINFPKTHANWSEPKIDEAYQSAAYNCWIAAGAYVVTFVISIWQNKIGTMRSSI